MRFPLGAFHRACRPLFLRQRYSRWRVAAGLIFLSSTSSVFIGQQNMPAGHSMADMQPVLPPEQLPAPIHMSGIGNAHIAITASAEAQVWFDQGLNLMHDFWDYESAKAFEQSVRVDPNCAMCWWGLAQAEGFAAQSETVLWQAGDWKRPLKLKERSLSKRSLYIEAHKLDAAIKKTRSAAQTSKKFVLLRSAGEARSRPTSSAPLSRTGPRGRIQRQGRAKERRAGSHRYAREILHDTPNDSATNHYWIHADRAWQSSGARDPECSAARQPCAHFRTHGAHAGAHLLPRRQLCGGGALVLASMAADERYMQEQQVGLTTTGITPTT